MQLLLVRHGLPVRVEDAGGPADPGLSPLGIEQAEALASSLRRRAGSGDPEGQVEAIWSSPMRRALETAQHLAPALDGGGRVEVDDGLREFDHDLHFYVPLEELRDSDDPRWAELLAEWTSAGSEEERRTFRTTVVGAVERIIAGHPSQRVAVVCHGGVINAYLSHVLGIDRTLFFEPVYTSVSRVLASSRGHRQLVSANETDHLRVPVVLGT
ncbi:MAG: histidine phosphatase family protein [Acidimicrobiales bacterium]